MKLPRRNIGGWARELVEECCVSRELRRSQSKMFRSFYHTGTQDGSPAVYNRCFPHVERLSSFLFSPVDVRFGFEYDETAGEEFLLMGEAAARYLNREFHRCNIDLKFSQSVNTALVRGCTLLKHIWGSDGLEAWPVMPEFFGVLREDIEDLDLQEAFVHTTYLTPNQFARAVDGHPDELEILRQVKEGARRTDNNEEIDQDLFHQITMGGIAPVATSSQQSTGSGTVGVVGIPSPMFDPKIAKELIRIDELWVVDSDRDDWTTIRLASPDIVVEGKLNRRNLSGVEGEQPFTKISPNEIPGYFWGLSEIAQIYKLQEMLNEQIRDLRRLTRLKSRPPRAFIGFAGMSAERYKTLNRPDGWMTEDAPTGKIETLSPEIPQELFTSIEKTIQYFDDVAGFTPILMGQGEQGVRAGVHASTLARNSSPRMRDRSLLTERQCVESGDFCFKLLQAKNAEVFDTEKKEKFLLKQLGDGYRVNVDSHTSSPAFQDDAQKLAFALHKAQAISPADLIKLTHPPHEDTLIMRAKQKAEAQEKLLKEHPELLLGKGKGRR